jgi:hypothetical protein
LRGNTWEREHGPDYVRRSYRFREHVRRFKAYVAQHGLPCQDCGGRGGYTEVICELGGPFYVCGFCHGTGRTTRHLRGLWLRWKRSEKRLRSAA